MSCIIFKKWPFFTVCSYCKKIKKTKGLSGKAVLHPSIFILDTLLSKIISKYLPEEELKDSIFFCKISIIKCHYIFSQSMYQDVTDVKWQYRKN